MKRKLTQQELHNLAMNIVGKDLEKRGFEFIAINSRLKKHPQFVCIDANNQRYFVIVRFNTLDNYPVDYDVIWMETFKNHAKKNNAKVLFAGLGLGSIENEAKYPNLEEDYLLKYEGLQDLAIELN
jgi:hypothetical protein